VRIALKVDPKIALGLHVPPSSSANRYLSPPRTSVAILAPGAPAFVSSAEAWSGASVPGAAVPPDVSAVSPSDPPPQAINTAAVSITRTAIMDASSVVFPLDHRRLMGYSLPAGCEPTPSSILSS